MAKQPPTDILIGSDLLQPSLHFFLKLWYMSGIAASHHDKTAFTGGKRLSHILHEGENTDLLREFFSEFRIIHLFLWFVVSIWSCNRLVEWWFIPLSAVSTAASCR